MGAADSAVTLRRRARSRRLPSQRYPKEGRYACDVGGVRNNPPSTRLCLADRTLARRSPGGRGAGPSPAPVVRIVPTTPAAGLFGWVGASRARGGPPPPPSGYFNATGLCLPQILCPPNAL